MLLCWAGANGVVGVLREITDVRQGAIEADDATLRKDQRDAPHSEDFATSPEQNGDAERGKYGAGGGRVAAPENNAG
jgi:hypothetical protein